MDKVKNGKIIVNICISTISLDRIWGVNEAILNNRQSSSAEIVTTCLLLAVIILHYLGNKAALDIIASLPMSNDIISDIVNIEIIIT